MSKAPSPEQVSRVVRWAIMLFLAYALISGRFHFFHDETPQAQQQAPSVNPGTVAVKEVQVKDCSSQSGLDDFSMLASAFMPSALPVIKTQDITLGTGDTVAVCGQKATLHFEYAPFGGKVAFSNFDGREAHVTLGDGKLMHGVELGMVGMKPGGTRMIYFPAVFGLGWLKDNSGLLGAEKFAGNPDMLYASVMVAKVSLVAVSPKLPDASQQLRVIDHSFGGGSNAQCGDTVQVEMTVWKLDGTKLFSTRDNKKPFTFRIGASQVPFGIEQSVISMTENSQRTVILPAAYTVPLVSPQEPSETAAGEDNPLTKLPREMLLVELRLQHTAASPRPKPAVALQPKPSPATTPPKEEKHHDKSGTNDTGGQ